MKTYNGEIDILSKDLLKRQIGKTLKRFQIWDIGGKGSETFDSVGLFFENCNIRLSCSCDHYDYSQQLKGDYTDVAVFKVIDCGSQPIPDPLLEMIPTEIPVDEKLTSVHIITEEVVTHFVTKATEDAVIHDRAIVLMFETKKLVICKSISWSDSLDVCLVSADNAIPQSIEWQDSEEEAYTVKEVESVIK